MDAIPNTSYNNGRKLSFESIETPNSITFANGLKLNFAILDEAEFLSTDKIVFDGDLE